MIIKRYIAGLIDWMITAAIQVILTFIFIGYFLQSAKLPINSVIVIVLKITLLSLIYMIIRDNLGKKSIGKRLMKLSIYDFRSNNTASAKQRLLRNVTWLLGLIEVIILLVSGSRLGDKLAKTKVDIDQLS
jgi:uncharacterized RDD family membrane protein YckC